MGIGAILAGNQVGELTPERRPVSLLVVKRTPSVCDRVLTKITGHLFVHSEKTKWRKAMNSIGVFVKMSSITNIETAR